MLSLTFFFFLYRVPILNQCEVSLFKFRPLPAILHVCTVCMRTLSTLTTDLFMLHTQQIYLRFATTSQHVERKAVLGQILQTASNTILRCNHLSQLTNCWWTLLKSCRGQIITEGPSDSEFLGPGVTT